MTEERLRELYAEHLERRKTGNRAGCIPPEDLQALVERTGPEAHRLGTLDHVMGCAFCSKEFELLRSMAQARPRTSALPGALGLAALLAFAVSAVLLWKAIGHSPPEPSRGGGSPVVVLGPQGEVPAGGRITFFWRALPGATRYEWELLSEKGNRISSRTTSDTSFILPDTVALTAGNYYRWWVQAVMADGSRLPSAMTPLNLTHP